MAFTFMVMQRKGLGLKVPGKRNRWPMLLFDWSKSLLLQEQASPLNAGGSSELSGEQGLKRQWVWWVGVLPLEPVWFKSQALSLNSHTLV